jgi:hypothetical protein
VDGLADRKIGRYHRLPCSGQMKEAGNAMFIGIRLLSILSDRGKHSSDILKARRCL